MGLEIVDFERVDRDFYLAYGHALGAWAQVERSVANLFGRIHRLDRVRAHAIFFSANSWAGRAAMAQASVPFAKTTPAGKKFLTQSISLASVYSVTRNTLAHDGHALHIDTSNLEAPKIERHITPRRSGQNWGGTSCSELASISLTFLRF